MNIKRKSETFSSVDATWLRIDKPTNLAIITGILTFDGLLDLERFRQTIQKRLLSHKRFLQKVYEPDFPWGLPRWEIDQNFDLDKHLHHTLLPEPGDHQELQKFVSSLMEVPLDKSKPLWDFYYIDNYQGGSALVCRIHHCIADGMALVQVILSTTDEKPDDSRQIETGVPQQELRPLARLLRPAVKAAMKIDQTWHATGDLFSQSLDFLTDPSRIRDTARTGKAASLALGKLLFIGTDRKTILRGKCGITKKAVWSKTYKVEEVKAIGKRMGSTINDILLSALTGALRQYLEEHDEPVNGLNIRTIVPVNLRSPEDTELSGNWFGLVFLSLPVGVRDPIKRLLILKRRMDAIKESPEAVVAFGILGALGMSPQQLEDIVVSIFGLKASAVMTNVPGPTQPLFLAGRKIENLMFWVPTPANLALGISILSYSGDVILGLTSDEGIIPDPENILNNFYVEMDKMSEWGLPNETESR